MATKYLHRGGRTFARPSNSTPSARTFGMISGSCAVHWTSFGPRCRLARARRRQSLRYRGSCGLFGRARSMPCRSFPEASHACWSRNVVGLQGALPRQARPSSRRRRAMKFVPGSSGLGRTTVRHVLFDRRRFDSSTLPSRASTPTNTGASALALFAPRFSASSFLKTKSPSGSPTVPIQALAAASATCRAASKASQTLSRR
mmetsp:Transcript_15747/g.44826  ORF Transcript_15747/g.44826 Transcript_15747/m.44826 type:complete len:202 (+) Transcript_15747:583-1188(+)